MLLGSRPGRAPFGRSGPSCCCRTHGGTARHTQRSGTRWRAFRSPATTPSGRPGNRVSGHGWVIAADHLADLWKPSSLFSTRLGSLPTHA